MIMCFGFLAAPLKAESDIVENSAFGTKEKSIEGLYEFVSQEIKITKPAKEEFTLSPPEWTGIWQIHDGYYSSVLMMSDRSKFFECGEARQLGYESFAGNYTITGKIIKFERSYSFHPLYEGKLAFMEYEINKDTLILTETLIPHIEDMRAGTVKIVLKKFDKKKKETYVRPPNSFG